MSRTEKPAAAADFTDHLETRIAHLQWVLRECDDSDTEEVERTKALLTETQAELVAYQATI